ncbi:nicotinate-nucleotide adenylyltransferase [Clostridium thermobutyricum]|uniref:Probable nicotinate-nucleotide adenylyltransferase n=1 Tax=Clostridium thermobutyricum DSM 4928 TaxID=1121339 RepID=A0A1V4SZB1_9CLOT|nr:nicotinate-nucleotide adenylyltransferase [Clostridium thermobutyricum]OPX49230.1 putative nicotinate-nucleotide adenylyltransferase [Clostridium thermobutyricum DSM 4928]
MKKYGIIGGTFDPIHFAHLYIADEAKASLELDKIIFMPNGNPPHKSLKKVSEASIRYEMVSEGIKDFKGFTVSDYEIKKNGPSFTYETLQAFKQEDVELFFITGADCLMDLEKWKNIKEIFKVSNFVVFSRPGFTYETLKEQKEYIENKYNTKIIFLNLKDLDISSTDIRERIRLGRNVKFFLPNSVLDIIERERLYK